MFALEDGEGDVFENGLGAEELVELEGAGEALADPAGLGEGGYVDAGHEDAAGGGGNAAGEGVGERGFSGAVGADEGVAGAGCDAEADVVDGGEGAEADGEGLGFERRGHGRLRRWVSQVTPPAMPPRMARTEAMRTKPRASCQYLGLRMERVSRAVP